MANSFKVNAQFTAKGNFDKKFTLWERAAARFSRNTEKSFRRASKGASQFKSVAGGIVAGLGVSKGLNLLSQGVGSVVTQFIAFDKAALGATVRFKDIGPTAANFNEQLKLIEKSARNAGATTQFTAAQAAEGLDFLARAGFTSAEAMLALDSMINLSIATGEDFASVADKSSDLLGAFGLNADNTADKIANLNRLNDVLVKSANSANVTIETMFETMKTAAPIGRKIGIELEEVAAITAVLGNAGIKGTEAGTAMKNMFLRLAAPTKAIRKTLSDVGVEIDDGSGNMRKFTDIMGDLSGATGEFGNLKVAKVLDTLFGKRAIAGAANIGDAIKQLADLEQTLKDAGGTSKLTAEIMSRSIEAKLLVLSSTATEFGFKILEAFRGDAKGGVDSLAESIRKLDVQPIIEDLKIIIGLAKTVLELAGLVAKATVATGRFAGETAAKQALGEKLPLPLEIAKLGIGLQPANIAGFLARKASTAVGDLLGGDGEKQSPNQAEAAARAQQQQATLRAQLNINAPAGTTMDVEQPSTGFSAELLGQN